MIDQDFEEHLRELGEALHFTREDLEANRAGQLTPAQIEHLTSVLRKAYWPGLIVCSILALMMGMLAILSVFEQHESAEAGITCLVGSLAFMVMAMLLAYDMRKNRLHLLEHPVKAVVIREEWLPHNKTRYEKYVWEITLCADGSLYNVMRAEQDYRAYYVEDVGVDQSYRRYREILSLEPSGDLLPEESKHTQLKAKRGMSLRARLWRWFWNWWLRRD
jgi:hypothetical protein